MTRRTASKSKQPAEYVAHAPPPAYVPYSSRNTTAEFEITRPKGASVFAQCYEEINKDGNVVAQGFVRGSFRVEPAEPVQGALRLEYHDPRAQPPEKRSHLVLDLGRGVNLLDLGHFAVALKALVDELFAQGANDEAWNTFGEGVGDACLKVRLDPRAPESA